MVIATGAQQHGFECDRGDVLGRVAATLGRFGHDGAGDGAEKERNHHHGEGLGGGKSAVGEGDGEAGGGAGHVGDDAGAEDKGDGVGVAADPGQTDGQAGFLSNGIGAGREHALAFAAAGQLISAVRARRWSRIFAENATNRHRWTQMNTDKTAMYQSHWKWLLRAAAE